MSLTQIANLRHSELLERIASFIKMDIPLQGTYQYVLTKTNDKWCLLIGILTLTEDNPEENFQPIHNQYPNFLFVRKSIEEITLTELIFNIYNYDSSLIPEISALDPKNNNFNWTESLVPSHASRGIFPERSFSSQISPKAHFSDSKLVAHGMPFYTSAAAYIREFLGLDSFNGFNDSRKGELSIKIPDKRGCLAVSDNNISFLCGTINNLSLVGAIDGNSINLEAQKDTLKFEIEKSSDIELWLITEKNEVVDYISSSEWGYRYKKRSDNEEQNLLLKYISGGESEHCEFKQYIELTKNNNKAWEIDKTVCAFSNHQGGKLFIGVDDEIRIVGINEGCQRDYKSTPKESSEYYLKAITKRLTDSLNKPQCFHAYLMEHYELFVLVVDVKKSNGLNYLLSKNEAYIRRGASSPQMTLSEIKAFPNEHDALGRDPFSIGIA